jgi:hypothetical protein
MRYLEDELGEHLAEFAPAATGDAGDYFVPNGSYDEVDGALLWAMLRRHRPRRVLELGSGYSSLLIRDALDANASDGPRAQHIVVDPFPRPIVLGPSNAPFDLRRISAGDLPAAEFEALAGGDVLFVDTTHTVKVGSEVNRIVLDALPLLRPGVLVQVHDIFLPWEYPRHLVEGLGYHWAEQYLLQAFLAFNEAFEVLVAAHLLVRAHRDALDRLLPLPPREASAFWLRRRP